MFLVLHTCTKISIHKMDTRHDKKKTKNQLMPITIEDFDRFFCCKAFDSVGNGSYRPYMHSCRDNGDDWAIQMYNSVSLVQAHIKNLHQSILSMPNVPCNIAAICKEVMLSSQPPVRLFFGSAVCCITSRLCSKCIDLSRNNKDTSRVYVDLRFGHFFMMIWYVLHCYDFHMHLTCICIMYSMNYADKLCLWCYRFCSKIEYIIRCFTRMWIDNNHETMTYKEMCTKIKTSHISIIERMHKLFVVSEQHINATLKMHVSKCMYTPVLKAALQTKQEKNKVNTPTDISKT